MERKKPSFWRKDWNKKIRLGSSCKRKRNWRRPTGLDNKNRLNRAGRAAAVNIGWGNDSSEKGKVEGVVPVRIETLKELEKIDKKIQGIIIARVGKKKKEEIIKQAEKKGIQILNRYRKKE